jgi:RHS repeat-associated protein
MTKFAVCASRYTGKERDTESGLDYFGARYYGSNMGRWMSPDWSAKEEPVPYAKLDNPQSLNLYGYVGNNPLSMADADGHDAYWVVDKQTGQATLVIPVHYTGSGATPANVSAIVNQDNSLNTGGSPVKIQVISTDKPINGVLNTLDLSPGADMTHYPVAGEGVNALGGDHGHINTDNAQANGAAAHDTLHFAGIKDQYKEGPKNPDGSRGPSIPNPGTQDNIMSSRTGAKLTPNQIQEAQRNKTTKQCTSDNGKTTCN